MKFNPRVLLLLVSGILLIGGNLMWVNFHNKSHELLFNQSISLQRQLPSYKLANKLASIEEYLAGITGSKEINQKQTAIGVIKAPIPLSSPLPAGLNLSGSEGVTGNKPLTINPTPREATIAESRQGTGRENPFSCPSGLKPFPRNQQELVLPPPPTEMTPLPANTSPGKENLSAEHPHLLDALSLVGVIDHKAVLTFLNPAIARRYSCSSTLILSSGDQLASVSVVDVGDDSVTLDEEGTRVVKNIQPIR